MLSRLRRGSDHRDSVRYIFCRRWKQAHRSDAQFISLGPVAQRLEQGTHNPFVPVSMPAGPTGTFSLVTPAALARLEERDRLVHDIARELLFPAGDVFCVAVPGDQRVRDCAVAIGSRRGNELAAVSRSFRTGN